MRRLACIDIGTVTARLGVAESEDGKVSRLAKTSTICDLGEGVAETGMLSEAAQDRVVSCVGGYLDAARSAGAEACCCTLTSAARDASNSDDLLRSLGSLGLTPEVIPGEVEGSLTFLGVAQDFPDSRILVADNGGGSTELALGTRHIAGGTSLDLEWVRSVDVGCRRVTELFLSKCDPPSASDVSQARDYARDLLHDALESAPAPRPEGLVVVGGTATTLVAIDAALDPYDPTYVHLHRLDRTTVERLVNEMGELTLEERGCLVGLQPKRAPVILAGSIIISELMGVTGMDELRVSESDLLMGLAIVGVSALEGTRSPVGWQPTLATLR
ncbi:MAG: phosphatase [Atopobiaceae bacterium]|nr:phosphatase [Atopobiaceae bacterium]MCI2173867.1 phosphatase [Atopobiaceae bacterium]MCI2208043.1 phosphatase [Atopobiaceae bacterium]